MIYMTDDQAAGLPGGFFFALNVAPSGPSDCPEPGILANSAFPPQLLENLLDILSSPGSICN